MLFCRNDEKVTCQKVLDKMGLQGYQVKYVLLAIACIYCLATIGMAPYGHMTCTSSPKWHVCHGNVLNE